jgi:hypothetical protein
MRAQRATRTATFRNDGPTHPQHTLENCFFAEKGTIVHGPRWQPGRRWAAVPVEIFRVLDSQKGVLVGEVQIADRVDALAAQIKVSANCALVPGARFR